MFWPFCRMVNSGLYKRYMFPCPLDGEQSPITSSIVAFDSKSSKRNLLIMSVHCQKFKEIKIMVLIIYKYICIVVRSPQSFAHQEQPLHFWRSKKKNKKTMVAACGATTHQLVAVLNWGHHTPGAAVALVVEPKKGQTTNGSSLWRYHTPGAGVALVAEPKKEQTTNGSSRWRYHTPACSCAARRNPQLSRVCL